MRDVKEIYGSVLCELMSEDENVTVVDADLMRIAGTAAAAARFPERYVNAGIAEQNAVAVAAGLAAMGKTVFVSAFCDFLATRAADQCLDTVCYNELNVKIVGTYAGISSGINGGTHISIMDLAAFRAMPGIWAVEPADGAELEWALREAARRDGPVYIRVPKGPLADVFAAESDFAVGRGKVLRRIDPAAVQAGPRIAVITSGITTYQAVEAVEMLVEEGIGATHIHLGSLKPADEGLLLQAAAGHDVLLTVENHSVIGGLGSAVCEAVSEREPVKVVRLGIEDVFCEGMTEAALADRHGISARRIYETARLLAAEGQRKG